jgi:hypothetical protein
MTDLENKLMKLNKEFENIDEKASEANVLLIFNQGET